MTVVPVQHVKFIATQDIGFYFNAVQKILQDSLEYGGDSTASADKTDMADP